MLNKDVIQHFENIVKNTYKYTSPRPRFNLPFNFRGIYLEAGCGSHVFWDPEDNTIVGVDIALSMIQSFQRFHEDTHLLIGDVLNIPIREKCISVLSLNNVLHHLIGKNKRDTLYNIEKSINNADKIIMSDGIIVIREFLLKNRIYRDLMYYITKFCSHFKINIDLLDIKHGVVTHFLLKHEIMRILIGLNYEYTIFSDELWKIFGINIGNISAVKAMKK